METKEMKAVISSKFRKSMLIAFIVYEAIILLLGILGFIVGYRYYDADHYFLEWWGFLRILRYVDSPLIHNYQNDFYAGNLVLAIVIIIVLMLLPTIFLFINVRRRKLTELTANEKEIVGSYTSFIPISKIMLKMPIEKIDNIAAVNSAFYWFTGKTIRISSTSSVIKIPFVENADAIVAFISEMIEKAKGGQKPTQPEKPQGDAADSLKKLAELRNAGIITEEEFNQKKNELLGKM